MYHINANNPLVESIRAAPDSLILPSAALGSTNESPQEACSTPPELLRSTLCVAPRLSRHENPLSSQAEQLRQYAHETIIKASWGRYQTLDQMRASPYYLCIKIPISSDNIAASPLSLDSLSDHKLDMVRRSTADPASCEMFINQTQPDHHLTLHAVHPIPTRYLRGLAQSQLEFLHHYLTEKRLRPDGELARRVYETLDAIRRVLCPEEECQTA
jgi:hypothetical protein